MLRNRELNLNDLNEQSSGLDVRNRQAMMKKEWYKDERNREEEISKDLLTRNQMRPTSAAVEHSVAEVPAPATTQKSPHTSISRQHLWQRVQ